LPFSAPTLSASCPGQLSSYSQQEAPPSISSSKLVNPLTKTTSTTLSSQSANLPVSISLNPSKFTNPSNNHIQSRQQINIEENNDKITNAAAVLELKNLLQESITNPLVMTLQNYKEMITISKERERSPNRSILVQADRRLYSPARDGSHSLSNSPELSSSRRKEVKFSQNMVLYLYGKNH